MFRKIDYFRDCVVHKAYGTQGIFLFRFYYFLLANFFVNLPSQIIFVQNRLKNDGVEILKNHCQIFFLILLKLELSFLKEKRVLEGCALLEIFAFLWLIFFRVLKARDFSKKYRLLPNLVSIFANNLCLSSLQIRSLYSLLLRFVDACISKGLLLSCFEVQQSP